MNKEEPPRAATLPVEPFGTQLSSKCQHIGGGGGGGRGDSRFDIKTD